PVQFALYFMTHSDVFFLDDDFAHTQTTTHRQRDDKRLIGGVYLVALFIKGADLREYTAFRIGNDGSARVVCSVIFNRNGYDRIHVIHDSFRNSKLAKSTSKPLANI